MHSLASILLSGAWLRDMIFTVGVARAARNKVSVTMEIGDRWSVSKHTGTLSEPPTSERERAFPLISRALHKRHSKVKKKCLKHLVSKIVSCKQY
ncbi:hypothetical protein CEXT_666491 [Caerostris extrusa]|uniref:Secreted protein n=1 Tax=Caerostris extrusa TaxID=172846 RepID=A0AAV4UU67_CAEEX|nr:hypothetical protein CEXT_666491 [Caerostris extrusa]